ncbi:fungal-specific transcription factor domain-containing protein [Schizophyllum amplum]|uniref:Fungal-specific transcription factor domain-containing protein n=1 Tax=Schizophyllum amplum TaxID=97359 RepID=A0A550CD02_9AGAR|nr:fungal-specific transcription factor domain-containing protein [Auriculariopsis ampla]
MASRTPSPEPTPERQDTRAGSSQGTHANRRDTEQRANKRPKNTHKPSSEAFRIARQSRPTRPASLPLSAPYDPYAYYQHPPHPSIMHGHPGYPMNPSPFAPGQPYPHPPPQGAPQPTMSPHQTAYHYPIHPQAYPPPYVYPGYPPTGHQMHAQQPPPPSPVASAPASSSQSGNKRKRAAGRPKNTSVDRASDDEMSPEARHLAELKKRTKTQRACDSCRTRKIRCDVIQETEPPVCQHCKQYGFECTFFLPITETRFKKKKTEDDIPGKDEPPHKQQGSSSQPQRDVGIVASIPSRVYESYDLRYNHAFEVSATGDGIITIQKPSADDHLNATKPMDVRMEPEVVERLLNAYFTDVSWMLPVITKQEFLSLQPTPPILLYSMCLVAAAKRDVAQSIFDSLRYTVNTIIKAEDILSTPSLVNVQAMLILTMLADCHSQFVPTALSALWIRLGAAIRMAQDLGLHRAESVKQNIEMRRRIWGACVISDRWISLTYGHPYMIDVQDCDARLPSSGDPNDLYMDELVRLSVILGRVLKTIYSWREGLPDKLKFIGPQTPRTAGLLHLLYTAVCMIFWRVFMRISYACPAHLKFGLTVEQWSKMVTLTGNAIDWLDANEDYYDVWLLVAYSATSCALVQYHTWARRKDGEAAAKLGKLRDTVRRWEACLSPDHMSARRKTAEIIALLYVATQAPAMPMEASPLNPTGGVTAKEPAALDFRKDPTRPGGGVYVAQGARAQDFKDLPAGTVLTDLDGVGGTSTTAAERDRPFTFSPSSFVPTLPTGVGMTDQQLDYALSAPSNVNPAMNGAAMGTAGQQVQVLNTLEGSQTASSLAEFQQADSFLDGLPGGMFDWEQWGTFFARLNNEDASAGGVFQPPPTQAPGQQPLDRSAATMQ